MVDRMALKAELLSQTQFLWAYEWVYRERRFPFVGGMRRLLDPLWLVLGDKEVQLFDSAEMHEVERWPFGDKYGKENHDEEWWARWDCFYQKPNLVILSKSGHERWGQTARARDVLRVYNLCLYGDDSIKMFYAQWNTWLKPENQIRVDWL